MILMFRVQALACVFAAKQAKAWTLNSSLSRWRTTSSGLYCSWTPLVVPKKYGSIWVSGRSARKLPNSFFHFNRLAMVGSVTSLKPRLSQLYMSLISRVALIWMIIVSALSPAPAVGWPKIMSSRITSQWMMQCLIYQLINERRNEVGINLSVPEADSNYRMLLTQRLLEFV
jgi:hypothetical protein